MCASYPRGRYVRAWYEDTKKYRMATLRAARRTREACGGGNHIGEDSHGILQS